jgi:hypothetical protein
MCKLFIVFYVHMDVLRASDWDSWEASLQVLISVWEFFDTPIVVPELVFREVCVKADLHIACRAHAAPMPFPCHAVPLRV